MIGPVSSLEDLQSAAILAFPIARRGDQVRALASQMSPHHH
jgi:hypothetical protein